MKDESKHIPDLRSYAFHKQAADILRALPQKLDDVNDVLDHWASMEGSQAQAWALKWRQLIEGLSVQEIAELICAKGEQMDFYRKSSPFSTLLSDEERLKIIKEIKYDYE